MDRVLFSSKSDEWSTPQNLFDCLNERFKFTLDPCATPLNHKCDKYYTLEDNGLSQDWTGHHVFCNPPYSDVYSWVKKASISKAFTVMLLPVRTDTKWFHEFIYKRYDVDFIKGRLKFGISKNSAPFPSMLVYFNNL